jgi:hypothetical protein
MDAGGHRYTIEELQRLYVEILKNDKNKWQNFNTMTSTQMARSALPDDGPQALILPIMVGYSYQ